MNNESIIPIEAAKGIAREYGMDRVVILGMVSDTNSVVGTTHVATYGKDFLHAFLAGAMGQLILDVECNDEDLLRPEGDAP